MGWLSIDAPRVVVAWPTWRGFPWCKIRSELMLDLTSSNADRRRQAVVGWSPCRWEAGSPARTFSNRYVAMEQRTFPIRVWPIEGEALSGWLDRYCSALSTSRIDLYRSIGLRPLEGAGQSRDHSLRISDEIATRVGFATGIPACDVQQLTMASYERRALIFGERRAGVDAHLLWARGTGTRYCPLCLREAPGVWPLAWRLSWSFACVRHGALLADECLGCGLVAWSRVRLGDVPVPNLCSNGIKGSDGHLTSCLTDLSQTPVVRLPEGAMTSSPRSAIRWGPTMVRTFWA